MSTPENNAEKPQVARPVMRSVVNRDGKWFETAVLWKNANPDSKAAFSGQIDINGDGRREHVFGFINDRKDGSGGKVISLTTNYTNPQSGEMGFRQVAIGNVVNHRSDDKPVYFDTVLFNPVDESGKTIEGSTPVSVYVTKDCDAEFHAKLGFASARVDRPKKEDAPEDDAGYDNPRGPTP